MRAIAIAPVGITHRGRFACRVASRNFGTDCLTKDVTDLSDEALKGPVAVTPYLLRHALGGPPSMCCLAGVLGFGEHVARRVTL
jgi:hypothetical protein